MRRLSCCQLAVLLLLAGMTAGAQVPNSSQNAQPSDNSPKAGVRVSGIEQDLHYVQHWSIMLDLKLLLGRMGAVLRGRNFPH